MTANENLTDSLICDPVGIGIQIKCLMQLVTACLLMILPQRSVAASTGGTHLKMGCGYGPPLRPSFFSVLA